MVAGMQQRREEPHRGAVPYLWCWSPALLGGGKRTGARSHPFTPSSSRILSQPSKSTTGRQWCHATIVFASSPSAALSSVLFFACCDRRSFRPHRGWAPRPSGGGTRWW